MGYQYTIVHQPGDQLANADGLSRLPTPTATPDPYETVLLVERLNSSLVTSAQIKAWTDRDPCLAKVRRQVLRGWPERAEEEEELKPYTSRRGELIVEDGCILWGTRVVVPPQLRSRVMDELHEGRPGMGKMKSFARSYVW